MRGSNRCQRFHIPLDGRHPDAVYRCNDMVVIFPVGAAEQAWTHAGDGLDLVIAGIEVGNDLIRTQLIEMVVVIGMVHHLVPRIMQRLHALGILFRPVPHYKERRLDLVTI